MIEKNWLEFLAQKHQETRVFLEKLSDKSMKDELSRLHSEASHALTPKDSVERLPIPGRCSVGFFVVVFKLSMSFFFDECQCFPCAETLVQQQEKAKSSFEKEQNDVLELLVADNKEIRGRLKKQISDSIRFK